MHCISYEDALFCMQKELWTTLDKHQSAIRDSAMVTPADTQWLNLYLAVSEVKSDTLAVLNCLHKLATQNRDLDKAIQWAKLSEEYILTHKDFNLPKYQTELRQIFANEADRLVLNTFIDGETEDSLYAAIAKLKTYNSFIEDLAKALVDMISVERNDSLSFSLTEKFYANFPHSKWSQAAYYFELAHYVGNKDYAKVWEIIDTKSQLSPAHAYLTTIYLLSPTLRRNLQKDYPGKILPQKASAILNKMDTSQNPGLVLYDDYENEHWKNRVQLQKAKAQYYSLISEYGFYGDEDSVLCIIPQPDTLWTSIYTLLFGNEADSSSNGVSFAHNNTGELAEINFWKGKLYVLYSQEIQLKKAASFFIECLSYGAPRKKYDLEAYAYLTKIHKKLKIKADLLSWVRQIKDYKGVVYKDITEKAGFKDNREARVALGDFNNDSYADILLNGRRLYKNNANLTFTEMSDTLGLNKLNTNGGLFADFNLDGKLDFMSISHSADSNGDKLMKNMGDKFAAVNDRAGEIDDQFPTEGAAWVDTDNDAYPDLYMANYEKWEVQSGYPDFFWNNRKGYFIDKSEPFGFRTPSYTKDPGQAGRGVSPADFDNDGVQEIYVSNYRLNRNFCWDKASAKIGNVTASTDTIFTDIAPLYGLQGILKKGYYGHTIGVDWGDYDNDGDLDLFVANLAHPRYIEISDISMLLRNDGAQFRIVAGDTIRYWHFTDVTKQAGITFDELHSDPMWLDADNDGNLDLFITSVYENDRSYLYHSNGDGTFTDVTWLSGTRVYNGWGNAFADFNHDGKLDMVVGSGNGTKLLLNQTDTSNKSIIFKPVWDDGKVSLISSYPAMKKLPNSPAFGARVAVTIENKSGKEFTLIRELCSAKGTTSQNDQILHFGIGRSRIIGYKLFDPKLP